MKKAIVSLALALVAAVAFALPTTQEVEAQVRQGNYSQAEAMMNEVVTARPGSARAHYVYAEILAHNRNFAKAADEAQKARQIDPALSFTDPAKFRAFEQLLAREQSAPKSSSGSLNIGPSGPSSDRAAPARTAPTREAPVREATGTPGWLWGLGAIALAWVAWRMMARRRAAGAAGIAAGPAGATGYAPMNPNAGGPYGPGNAYAPGQPIGPAATGRAGSGMLGTGMAVAGGVAGGMLLNEMLNRRHEGGATGNAAQAGNDGLVPGIFDTGGDAQVAANELQSREVDFGSGNDWGGDAGGSIDVGDVGGGGDDWG
jgi:hypothetical protein